MTPEEVRAHATEPCREWVDDKWDRCNETSQFILWGKLFPPEAMGPRCYEHAEKHIGSQNMSPEWIKQWAVFDLRPLLEA